MEDNNLNELIENSKHKLNLHIPSYTKPNYQIHRRIENIRDSDRYNGKFRMKKFYKNISQIINADVTNSKI